MLENSTSAPMNNNPESAIPTIAQPYAPDLLPTLLPSSPLPNWLLAIVLLVTLTDRLRQLLLLIAYLLQKPQDSKKK